MALSNNLKLRGAAARTDLRDRREYLEAVAANEIKKKAAMIDQLIRDCIDIEGDSFITWWDDELPAKIPQSEQIQLLNDRLVATGARLELARRADEYEANGKPQLAELLRDAISKII